ncbi:IS3 family transposase, partial [Cryobacterium sp. TMT2-10]|uniref:IS3 family transposase n=1 Tax=Cryobacterium sp. TMT2-10 TaxID=1259244 RepID=UPI003511FA2A
MAESIFATLKAEFYYRRIWPTRARAIRGAADWIEGRYNRRRHSSIGHVMPVVNADRKQGHFCQLKTGPLSCGSSVPYELPRRFRTAELVFSSTLPGLAVDNHSGLRWVCG